MYFIVISLCYFLPSDIDQQMYTDTRSRSYIFAIMTDVMGNMGASIILQIQLAACFHPHITQFKVVSVCAEMKRRLCCYNFLCSSYNTISRSSIFRTIGNRASYSCFVVCLGFFLGGGGRGLFLFFVVVGFFVVVFFLGGGLHPGLCPLTDYTV